jgi:hypothetical protein
VHPTFLTICLAVPLIAPGAADPSGTQENQTSAKKSVPKGEAPDDSTIKKLIAQLGSASFSEREAAMKGLERIGKPALPALREAAKNHDDAETRRRAERLVRHLSPDPLDELIKEVTQLEKSTQFKKAAELLDKAIVKAKERYHPGPAAPAADIPILTDLYLRSARLQKRLGEYERAANAFHIAEYYSNYHTAKRKDIHREWSEMTTSLLAEWEGTVKKKMNDDASLKGLAAKYPLVVLHTRRYAGGDYLQSTYSFLYETTVEAKHFNDVQLQFDNGTGKNTFEINMVVGQENRVADLGQIDFTKDPKPANIGADARTQWCSKECRAQDGHVYLEEVKDDRGNHFFVVFQVVATDKDSRFLAFLWRKLPGGTVVKRP